ncbi:unnamed protein product, partial [Owenia fusiformis]
IDECKPINPCWNNGKCVNAKPGFKCTCSSGIKGDLCQEVCVPPRTPSGVIEEVPSNGYLNSIVRYNCKDGETLEGSRARRCEIGGEYSGVPPKCSKQSDFQSKKCPDLKNPSNGVVTGFGGYIGMNMKYECNPGYILKGDAVRTCTKEGKWSGDEVTCEDFGDGNDMQCPNLKVMVIDKADPSCRKYIECFNNEITHRECQGGYTFSNEEKKCLPAFMVPCGFQTRSNRMGGRNIRGRARPEPISPPRRG